MKQNNPNIEALGKAEAHELEHRQNVHLEGSYKGLSKRAKERRGNRKPRKKMKKL